MSFGKFRDDNSGDKPAGSSPSAVGGGAGNYSGSGLAGKSEAFLGKGTKVSGTLTFTGPVELDGFVEGEITAKDSLTIGESAVVNAKVHGAEIIIRGNVTGDVVASKKLSLRKPARVSGNISSPVLSIEDGVQFEGKCSMSSSGAAMSTTSAEKTLGAVA